MKMYSRSATIFVAAILMTATAFGQDFVGTISPATVTSGHAQDKTVAMTVSKTSGVKGIATVKVSDGTTNLTTTVLDNSSDTELVLRVVVPKGTEGSFTVTPAGFTASNVTLEVKKEEKVFRGQISPSQFTSSPSEDVKKVFTVTKTSGVKEISTVNVELSEAPSTKLEATVVDATSDKKLVISVTVPADASGKFYVHLPVPFTRSAVSFTVKTEKQVADEKAAARVKKTEQNADRAAAQVVSLRKQLDTAKMWNSDQQAEIDRLEARVGALPTHEALRSYIDAQVAHQVDERVALLEAANVSLLARLGAVEEETSRVAQAVDGLHSRINVLACGTVPQIGMSDGWHFDAVVARNAGCDMSHAPEKVQKYLNRR